MKNTVHYKIIIFTNFKVILVKKMSYTLLILNIISNIKNIYLMQETK